MASTMLNMPNITCKTSTYTYCEYSNKRICSFTKMSLVDDKRTIALQVVAPPPTLLINKSSIDAANNNKVVEKKCTRLTRLWKEIQGKNNWETLVQPLDPLLRAEIIRYGEFVTACYKAFDLDPSSKRYLNCMYGKNNMLQEVGLGCSGYEVTKYIYATPDINLNIPLQSGGEGKWIGYVAVSNDETVKKIGRRDILITFRGTVTNHEWIANLMSSLTPARLDPHDTRPEVQVEAGFLSLYTSSESDCKFGLESCREQLLSEVSRLLNKFKGEEISITLAGHSMGSSLALLLAYDLAELGLNRKRGLNGKFEEKIPITVFSFGGPRVGNLGFKERCEELGVKVLRVVNEKDPVTKLPGILFNEDFSVNFGILGGRYEFSWSCSCYAHVGVELLLDFFKMQNPSCVHDLESYISLLKCSSSKVQSEGGVDLIKKVMTDFVQTRKDHLINNLPWKAAALNMMNLVQSQRAYLTNNR